MKQINQKLWMTIAFLWVSLIASAYDFEVDGISYSVVSLEDATCNVALGDIKYRGDVTIPAEITYKTRNLKVVGIEETAFRESYSLVSLTLPKSITTIGYGAFYKCESLESITLPNTLTSIGELAFSGCKSLKSITIPNSVTSIGEGAFWGCLSLTSIVIPNSVTSIECETFKFCISLESISIPNSITSIKTAAFTCCASLKSITLPNSLTFIGSFAFSHCEALKTITIPNSDTFLGPGAFYGCESLKSIKLSNSLESLEYGTFAYCKELESIEIPGSVKTISGRGDEGFGGGEYFFREKDKTYDHALYTFQDCPNLKKVSILYSPETLIVACFTHSLRYSGSDVYKLKKNSNAEDVKNCTEFDAPNGHREFGFYKNKITELYIDRYLNTFLILPDLEKLEIGEHIKGVTVSNLPDLEKLNTIVCYGLVPPQLPQMTNAQYMDIKVFVPKEAIETYKADPNWKNFWNIQALGGN